MIYLHHSCIDIEPYSVRHGEFSSKKVSNFEVMELHRIDLSDHQTLIDYVPICPLLVSEVKIKLSKVSMKYDLCLCVSLVGRADFGRRY